MKQGWEIKRLKEVCEKITDGTHQTPKYFDEGFVFLSSRNVTSGKIDWDNIKYIDEKQHLEMHKRVAPKIGDILLAKNGTTGVAAMVDRDVVFDIYVSLAHLRPLKNLTPFYLLYFINSPLAKNQFNKRLKGAGVPNLHLEEIREVEIPIPSITEQQRIVAILDEAFEAIEKAKANAEQNLKNAKELFESYLQGVFENKGEGWEEITLGVVCKVIAGQSPEGKYYNKNEKGIPFYQGKKEFGEKYIGEPTVWTTKVTKEAEANDILMSVRAPVGPINFATQKICIGRGLAAIRGEKNIDNEFLYLFLLNNEKKIVSNQGAVFNSINKNQIESIQLLLPPLKKQQTIVQKLNTLSNETKKLEAIYQQKINDLEELKKSILQKAFSGELK